MDDATTMVAGQCQQDNGDRMKDGDNERLFGEFSLFLLFSFNITNFLFVLSTYAYYYS